MRHSHLHHALARVYLLVLAFLVLANSGYAQGSKATVAGRIEDSQGGVLQGAMIVLDPGGLTAVSGAQGEFTLNGVQNGTYTVTVSYVGLQTYTAQLEVKAGTTVRADAQLKVAAASEEIIVTAARASGEAEEVNRERTADNLVQVLTSDVIRSLPNANMADALGRLPSVTIERDEGEGKYVQVRGTEPRLTNATIDGVNIPSPESGVRQIKFDAIPADIVESVEINKTLQANMDGDGIGGSVNLVTKTAGERPTISLAGMGGYTPILGGRSNIETAGTLGRRFGTDKRFGLLIGGTYDWNGRGIDDIEPVPDIANFGTAAQRPWFDQTDIREYRYYRSRWGVAGSADYKLGEGSNLYARLLYSDFHNYGDRWVYTIFDNTTPSPTLSPTPGTPRFNAQQRRPDYAIGSLLIGGKHVLSTTWYSWDVSVSRSSQAGQVGNNNADFAATNLASSNCQFDPTNTTNRYLPQWTPDCFSEAYNEANYTLSDVSTQHGLTAQLNLQFAGAMAKRYHLGSHLATIEIGGKFRNAHKFDNQFSITWIPNGSVPMTDFPSRFSGDNYYGGHYQLGPNPSFPDIFAFVQANPTQFTETSTAGADPSAFSLIEKVSAGYVMHTLDFSKIRLVAGVRFEGTNLDTKTPLSSGNVAGFFNAGGSYVKVLPSASIRYALTSATNLRLVYSRGLSRPDPQDIAQAITTTPGVNPIPVSIGNPNLKAETADNLDVLIEHYINPFGMITAGYFYKNLTQPIVTQSFFASSGNFGGATCTPSIRCDVSQPINAGSAWLNGFEVAYLQHLTFLPGVLKGFGVSANYGYTASRASGLPGRSDHPRLIRNAPHTWNVSPTYDRGRVSIRAGISYNAANINAYQYKDGTPLADGTPTTPTPGGLRGPFSDDYFFAHLQVDAQGSVRLAHGLSFVAYGLNLTNEVFGFYFGSPQYFHQREYYRPTYAFGFRWNPTFEGK